MTALFEQPRLIRWYRGERPAYKFRVRPPADDMAWGVDQARRWCKENGIEHDHGHEGVYVFGETAATAFKLRWC